MRTDVKKWFNFNLSGLFHAFLICFNLFIYNYERFIDNSFLSVFHMFDFRNYLSNYAILVTAYSQMCWTTYWTQLINEEIIFLTKIYLQKS